MDMRYIPEPNTGCWLWMGYISTTGYGSYHTMIDGKRTKIAAHRMLYEEEYGPIPAVGMSVLHKCDNTICVNPKHMFLGTHQDNMDDMAKKGRRKMAIPNIHKNKIKDIRTDYENGLLLIDLIDKYGIEKRHMTRILSRKVWRNL